MNCKTLGCGNKQRIMPTNGTGSFKGFDVFQCPGCKKIATTVKKGKNPFSTAEAPDYSKLVARDKQLKTPIKGLSMNPNKLGVKRPYRNQAGKPYTEADINKSLVNRIDSFIEKAGAEILPCKTCGVKVPHFKSSPPTTQGLCSECIRTSLSKPKVVGKIQKSKIYLKPGQKAPQGLQVMRGPKGAYYYESSGNKPVQLSRINSLLKDYMATALERVVEEYGSDIDPKEAFYKLDNYMPDPGELKEDGINVNSFVSQYQRYGPKFVEEHLKNFSGMKDYEDE